MADLTPTWTPTILRSFTFITRQYRQIEEYCNEIRHDCYNSNSDLFLLLSCLPLDAIEFGLLIEVKGTTNPPTHTHPHTHPPTPTHTHTHTHTHPHTHTHTHAHTSTHIQGVPGGKDLTSGECSLGQTITIWPKTTISKVQWLRRYWPEKSVDFFGVCVMYSVRDDTRLTFNATILQ